MSAPSIVACRNVSFSYGTSDEPLLSDVSAYFHPGFTGIVGANGAGKTTLLRLLVGELAPSDGFVEGAGEAVYCAQRTDNPPASFGGFLEDWDGSACELRGRLQIHNDYLERWDSLSHGERKRAQIAHALWQSPALLAIDEPPHPLAATARSLVIAALQRFRGVGLIVSHDRELLDELCARCLWIEPPHVEVYVGGISKAREQRHANERSAIREREKAVAQRKRLEHSIATRRGDAAKEHKVRSKRGLAKHDSDSREKIDRARATDGNGGSQLRQLGGRLAQAQARVEAAAVKKTYTSGIWLESSRSSRNAVLTLPAGKTTLSEERDLEWPSIIIEPDQRIAVTGDNGTGKSTWINHIRPLLNVEPEHVIFLPQEVSAETAREIKETCQRLPDTQLGHIMTIVSRLNSRPERLLGSRQPSPGEVRKLMLALGMSRKPHMIMMDEPTNHLDLPSIEALESALSECPCALLLVSHDQRFIERVGASPWTIETNERGNSILLPQ